MSAQPVGNRKPWPPPLQMTPQPGDDDLDGDLDVLALIIKDNPPRTTVHLVDKVSTKHLTSLAPAVACLIAVFLVAPDAPMLAGGLLAVAGGAASWFVAMRTSTKAGWLASAGCVAAVILGQTWMGLPVLTMAVATWFALSRGHSDRDES